MLLHRAGSGPSLSQPGGSIPPWSIYAEEAHLMVMRLREEKEQELQQLNREWREKMEAREQEVSLEVPVGLASVLPLIQLRILPLACKFLSASKFHSVHTLIQLRVLPSTSVF